MTTELQLLYPHEFKKYRQRLETQQYGSSTEHYKIFWHDMTRFYFDTGNPLFEVMLAVQIVQPVIEEYGTLEDDGEKHCRTQECYEAIDYRIARLAAFMEKSKHD